MCRFPSRIAGAALALAVTCAIAACTGSQTQVVQVAAPPAAGAPASGTRIVRHVTIPVRNVGAPSGKHQNLDFMASLDADCISIGSPVITVFHPPAHGHAESFPADDYPNFSAGNPRAHCNDRRVPGTRLVYTSDPGYTGPDPFAISVLFPSGSRVPIIYAMVVQ